MDRQQCSYGRNGGHVCRGVNFISRGGPGPLATDYCVDGDRVRVVDGEPLPQPIFIWQLDQYAEYLRWRSQPEHRFLTANEDGSYRPPQPFEFTLQKERP